MADAVAAVLDHWRRARPDLDPSPIGVVGRVMRLARLWDKEIKRFLADHDLEPGEFDVLATLRRSGEPFELTAGAFLEASLVTTGAITQRVDRMEAKGLVARTPDAQDRRAVRIRLTAHGLETVDRVLPLHLANHRRLIEALDDDARAALESGLTRLLEASGDVARPRDAPAPAHTPSPTAGR